MASKTSYLSIGEEQKSFIALTTNGLLFILDSLMGAVEMQKLPSFCGQMQISSHFNNFILELFEA
jgi:hypothetical protein